MSNPDNQVSPPAGRVPGEVRMTDAGEAEIFDGAGWRPLASLAQDPDTGARRIEGAREPQGRPEDGEAGEGTADKGEAREDEAGGGRAQGKVSPG